VVTPATDAEAAGGEVFADLGALADVSIRVERNYRFFVYDPAERAAAWWRAASTGAAAPLPLLFGQKVDFACRCRLAADPLALAGARARARVGGSLGTGAGTDMQHQPSRSRASSRSDPTVSSGAAGPITADAVHASAVAAVAAAAAAAAADAAQATAAAAAAGALPAEAADTGPASFLGEGRAGAGAGVGAAGALGMAVHPVARGLHAAWEPSEPVPAMTAAAFASAAAAAVAFAGGGCAFFDADWTTAGAKGCSEVAPGGAGADDAAAAAAAPTTFPALLLAAGGSLYCFRRGPTESPADEDPAAEVSGPTSTTSAYASAPVRARGGWERLDFCAALPLPDLRRLVVGFALQTVRLEFVHPAGPELPPPERGHGHPSSAAADAAAAAAAQTVGGSGSGRRSMSGAAAARASAALNEVKPPTVSVLTVVPADRALAHALTRFFSVLSSQRAVVAADEDALSAIQAHVVPLLSSNRPLHGHLHGGPLQAPSHAQARAETASAVRVYARTVAAAAEGAVNLSRLRAAVGAHASARTAYIAGGRDLLLLLPSSLSGSGARASAPPSKAPAVTSLDRASQRLLTVVLAAGGLALCEEDFSLFHHSPEEALELPVAVRTAATTSAAAAAAAAAALPSTVALRRAPPVAVRAAAAAETARLAAQMRAQGQRRRLTVVAAERAADAVDIIVTPLPPHVTCAVVPASAAGGAAVPVGRLETPLAHVVVVFGAAAGSAGAGTVAVATGDAAAPAARVWRLLLPAATATRISEFLVAARQT
jgi:hypothetical protein